MGKEFELKYAATPEIQQVLLAELGDCARIAMETTYYDTPGRELSARHITLRRRYENGVSVCTLKAPLGKNSRREWETEAATIEEGLPALCKLSNWQELAEITAQGLMPLCGARFTRHAATVALPDCTVEIAVDAGVLTAGEKEVPLCEIEVELKSGSEDAAVYFAGVLAAKYGLRREPKSKFRRAMDLVE
ncbi:MAG: CYTH domain-containing protein [Ruminococcaceae bacterium]|nr:CYTH domain-containing protein [Oscillospiraceae bacterium]